MSSIEDGRNDIRKMAGMKRTVCEEFQGFWGAAKRTKESWESIGNKGKRDLCKAAIFFPGILMH